jgi:hypothetical protein
MAEENIYSKCGFFCNLCPAFRGNLGTADDRQRGSVIWGKYFGLHLKPDSIRCAGCQSPEPWQTGNLLPDRRCHIRACAVHNGVKTCAHCSLFPCEEYSKHVPSADLRQQRERASNIKFTDGEYLEHLEPFEGQPHLKDLRSGLRAEDILPPQPFSTREHIVPFPPKTRLLPAEQAQMLRLHSVLESIFAAQAVNYAGQVLLERQKSYIYGIIWVMGLYGELKAGQLVLESVACQDKKECTRLVRKTTNTLHDAIQDAVNRLSTRGIQVVFKPLQKSWTLTLSIDEKVGGPALLDDLRTYISSLVNKYGAPVYAGSYDLKGQAFKLFTRLDMRGL